MKPKKGPFLIINADDFWHDGEINRAIVGAFQGGWCSSATVMPNMPGFEEAAELCHQEGLEAHVGLHLVLRDGFPLTDEMRRHMRFCDRMGRLCLSRQGMIPILHLSGEEQKILASEIRAQIQRCRAFRIPLTHLDSHYHLHNEWAVAQVVISVARAEGIPYVRIARNVGPGLSCPKRWYKASLNRYLSRVGMARTRYFGSAKDIAVFRKHLTGQSKDTMAERASFEVMIHPTLTSEGLVDAADGKPIRVCVEEIEGHRSAVSFQGSR